jgi:hypothetical protein
MVDLHHVGGYYCAIIVAGVACVIHLVDAVSIRDAGIAEVVFDDVLVFKYAVFVANNGPLSIFLSLVRFSALFAFQ